MKEKKFDKPLFFVSVILVLFGIFVLAGVSAVFSQEEFGNPTYFLFHQILYGIIPGAILGFFAFKIRLSLIKKWILPLFLLNVIVLGSVFIPQFGFHSGGATRWISVGPLSFQPAEFLKITFLLYLAALISSKSREFARKRRGIDPMLFIFLVLLGTVTVFLAMQPNIGTLSIIFSTAVLVYFAAGTPLWQTAIIILMGLGGLIALIKIAPYRLNRLSVFLNPETDVLGIGYQVKQALIAIGSGGLLGLGFGASRQKFGFLPQSIGDSIFAVLAEEGGFLWAFILIALFVFFVWRGFSIAKHSRELFGRLAAVGICTWIVIQAFLNISSMIGILPLTGVPLPFISYGGSHIAAELIGVGILLNISKTA